MLQEKKISSKINYEVLKDLNRVSETKKALDTPEMSLLSSPVVEATPVVLKSAKLEKRFRRSSLSLDSKSGEVGIFFQWFLETLWAAINVFLREAA